MILSGLFNWKENVIRLSAKWKFIQPLEKSICTNRQKIRKNMLSSLSFLTHKHQSCLRTLNKLHDYFQKNTKNETSVVLSKKMKNQARQPINPILPCFYTLITKIPLFNQHSQPSRDHPTSPFPHPSHSAHPPVVKRKALMLITLLLYDFCAFRCVCRANVGVDRRYSPPDRLLGGGAGHAAPHFRQSGLEH